MVRSLVDAVMGRRSYDRIIRNVRVVNVYTEEIVPGDIGIVDGMVACVGDLGDDAAAGEVVDGKGRFAVPGFIDSHMHLESSMMTPANFTAAVVPLGTVAVAADPHEIANVMGKRGVEILCEMTRDLPLQVSIMAPSTVPSAPGFETAGADLEAEDVKEILSYDGVLGLGEVMDFNGVVASDEKMTAIIDAARETGCLMDAHVPLLKGRSLQAFVSTGLDCDHTYMDVDSVAEKLRCGMWVQIQERYFTPELMAYLNESPAQGRILLATDDVPISRLAEHGHVDHLIRKAISMGLKPMNAYRYVTVNAAERLRMYRSGGIAPGKRADIVMMDSLEQAEASAVFCGGELTAENGKLTVPVPEKPFPPDAFHTLSLGMLEAADFRLMAEGKRALVNVMVQDGKTSRTVPRQAWCPVKDGCVERDGVWAREKGEEIPCRLAKMAVFNRYPENGRRSIGFLGNLDEFRGAIATTYAHDCHNLTVYGSSDEDMAAAANLVIRSGGGVAAVKDGRVLAHIPLPIAGLLCEDRMEVLAEKFENLTRAAEEMKLNHEEVLTFITLMALAVSPEIKLTDMGLVDVVHKCFVPCVEKMEE